MHQKKIRVVFEHHSVQCMYVVIICQTFVTIGFSQAIDLVNHYRQIAVI